MVTAGPCTTLSTQHVSLPNGSPLSLLSLSSTVFFFVSAPATSRENLFSLLPSPSFFLFYFLLAAESRCYQRTWQEWQAYQCSGTSFFFSFFLLSNFWLLEVFDFSIPKLGLAMCLFVSVCLFLSPYICIYTQLGYLHFFFPDSISFGFVGGWGELMIK